MSRILEDRDSDECSVCGKKDYRVHFLVRDSKPYCDDCAEELDPPLTEENTE